MHNPADSINQNEPPKVPLSMNKWIRQLLWPHRGFIALQLLVSMSWTVDANLMPYITKKIIDYLSLSNLDEAWHWAILYIVLQIALPAFWRLYDYSLIKYPPRLNNDVSRSLTNYLWGHSHQFFLDRPSGGIANQVRDAAHAMPELVNIFSDTIFSNILIVSTALIAISTISFKFAIAMAIWLTLFLIVTLFSVRKAISLSRDAARSYNRVIATIVDTLTNISSVRLFSRRRYERKLTEPFYETYERSANRRDWFLFYLYIFQSLLYITYQTICILMLMYGYQEGTVSAGDFAMLISINVSIMSELWELSKELRDLTQHYSYLKQAYEIISTPHEITDVPDAPTLIVRKGSIKFENLTFSYENRPPLFEQLNIDINPGEKVGLVGYSGSGKTTLISLLLRLYSLSEGRITIDGQDISHVSQDSLRESIAVIPQEPTMFHRSIYDNLIYANPDATEEEVIAAAKIAHAHDFICNLQDGYDCLVGERGIKLSGGQRQRIAIARAILKNAPILILDEATSQLDSLTEELVQDSIGGLMKDRTTLVIAHRLSTLLQMDRILVFNQGKLVQDGSHKILLEQKGLYKQLWEAQNGGFLPGNNN